MKWLLKGVLFFVIVRVAYSVADDLYLRLHWSFYDTVFVVEVGVGLATWFMLVMVDEWAAQRQLRELERDPK